MKVSHNWLKEYVGDLIPEPQALADLLTFHAFEIEDIIELKNDTIIDIDVLPNRASDCLSHRGIAREIATLLDQDLTSDPLSSKPEIALENSKIQLFLEDKKDCLRFTAAVVEGVKVAESPDWLKECLEGVGQRSINNVVDATNLVMFAMGQPTHAFDFDKLAKAADGTANITVRRGQAGESLTLLSGEEIESDESMLHLVDGNADVLLDLAGIKGGQAAELTNGTTNIVVTSGNFDFQLVRKTAQRLKIFTDASNRNQNGPSSELAGYGLRDTVELILKLAGGDCSGLVEIYPVKPQLNKVAVTSDKANTLLGLDLSPEEIKSLLTRVAATVESVDAGFVVSAPFERTDLNIEEDYIEEIGRVYGYEKIASVVPPVVSLGEVNMRHVVGERIRSVLTHAGFSEVITSSFTQKDKIQLQNALASDKSYLRSNLSKNLTAAMQKNISNVDVLGLKEIKLFEIGTVFSKGEGEILEHVSLAISVQQKPTGYSPKDDVLLKEAIDIVETEVGVSCDFVIEKGVAECNFSVVLEKIPQIESYDDYIKPIADATYLPFSTYPAVSRDIALWVDDVTESTEVEFVLNQAAGDLRVRTTLFDRFTKDGRTSFAFRLVFQASDRTLVDEEVNKKMDGINDAVQKMGWEVR